MKLDGFRELLVKKAGNVSVANLVRFMRDDVLSDLVIESLEKMANHDSNGSKANLAIRDFGSEMDPEHEPKMIHDALSHHASQYKAALNSGNKNLSNAHAKQMWKILDLAHKVQSHSDGKLDVDAVATQPWERNLKSKSETFGDRMNNIKRRIDSGEPVSDKEKDWLTNNPTTRANKKPHFFINDTENWGYGGKDFSFLQQAPHESKADEVRLHGHNGAYPLEAIKINGKHIDIEDRPPSDHYISHPFDSHPIMEHSLEKPGERTPERDAEYRKARDEYAAGPHMDKYFADMESRQEKDPQAHASRGEQMSAPVHAPVTPLDTESYRVPQESAPSSAPTSAPAAASQAAPAAAPPSDAQREARRKVIATLPPELRAKMSKLYGE